MIEELIATSEKYDERKADFGPAPAQSYRFDDSTCNIITPATLLGSASLPMTDHALNQVCGRLGPVMWPDSSASLPFKYLKDCPPGLRAYNLNHWTRRAPEDKEWLARAITQGQVDYCRAILTNKFAVIDVTETLQWVKEALDSKGGGLSIYYHRPVVTSDVLHLRMLWSEVNTGGSKGTYRVGGYITTGEIGNRRIGAYPLIQRTSCTNSIMIPDNKFSYEHIHRGSRLVIRTTFIAAVFDVIDGCMDALERLITAQEQEIPHFAEYIENLAKDKGWSIETKDNVLVGSEGYESLFGLVQGISAASNKVEDPDEQANMQLFAGSLLFQPRRERVNVQ